MSPESDFLPTEIADLPLLRIASDLAAMAWEQMTAWRGSLGASLDESVVDTKSSPNDLVTLADAQIESLVRGFLAEVRPNDLMVGEEGAAALDPVEFFPEEFLAELSCFGQEVGRVLLRRGARQSGGRGHPPGAPTGAAGCSAWWPLPAGRRRGSALKGSARIASRVAWAPNRFRRSVCTERPPDCPDGCSPRVSPTPAAIAGRSWRNSRT